MASIVDDYELDEHELALLVEAVRTVDTCDRLDARVRKDGEVVDSPQGLKAHSALVEARQRRITLARLLVAMRMPSGEEEGERANRRTGVRGVYTGNVSPAQNRGRA